MNGSARIVLALCLLCLSTADGKGLIPRMKDRMRRRDESAKRGIASLRSFFGGPAIPIEPSTLSLIGAGLPGTDTQSTQEALEMLGYKVYGARTAHLLGHGTKWIQATAAAQEDKNYTSIDALLAEVEGQGYNATLDFAVLAPLLAVRRPRAKVLLTVRETDKAWLMSLSRYEHVYGVLERRPFSWFGFVDSALPGKLLRTMYPGSLESLQDPPGPDDIWYPVPWFGLEASEETDCCSTLEKREVWRALAKKVRTDLALLGPSSNSADSRFLVWGTHEGWAPLLQFLGVQETPDVLLAFPHVSDWSSHNYIRQLMQIVGAAFPLFVFLVIFLPLLLLGFVTDVSCRYCWGTKKRERLAAEKKKLEKKTQ